MSTEDKSTVLDINDRDGLLRASEAIASLVSLAEESTSPDYLKECAGLSAELIGMARRVESSLRPATVGGAS